MYPLQGDHKRPEVSQTGMVQTQAPIQQEVQPVQVVQAEPARPVIVDRTSTNRTTIATGNCRFQTLHILTLWLGQLEM